MTLLRIDFRSRTAAVLAAGVIAVAGLAGPALGQIGLPDSLINSPTLGADEKDQIKKLVDSSKAGLSGQIDAIATARRALLRPFRAPSVSSAFRIEYATQVLPVIRPLVGDKVDEVAINATRIAGELGTRDAMALLATAIKDPRAAVRVVAAKGYEQTFTTARSQPAIGVRDAAGALENLKTAFGGEAEPHVADAIIDAMDAAVRSDPALLPGVRADAVKAISDVTGPKMRSPEAFKFAAAFARATDSLHDAVTTGTGPANTLSEASLKDAAAVAGDMIAAGVRQSSGKMPEGEVLSRMKQLLVQAENLYFFSHNKIDPTAKPLRRELGSSFGTDNAKFKRDALEVLGVLTNPAGPFKLPKDRFPTN